MHVGDHADYAPVFAVRHCDLSNRVFPGPERSRNRLIKDDHLLASGAVFPAKVAPPQTHAHGAQITGRNHIYERAWKFTWTIGLPFYSRSAPTAVLSQRQVVHHARGLDAWNCLDTPQNLLKDHAPLLGTVSVVVVNLQCGGHSGLESQINVEHAEKTSQQ